MTTKNKADVVIEAAYIQVAYEAAMRNATPAQLAVVTKALQRFEAESTEELLAYGTLVMGMEAAVQHLREHAPARCAAELETLRKQLASNG